MEENKVKEISKNFTEPSMEDKLHDFYRSKIKNDDEFLDVFYNLPEGEEKENIREEASEILKSRNACASKIGAPIRSESGETFDKTQPIKIRPYIIKKGDND